MSFLAPLGVIFLSELGDKSQLLILSMATRYQMRQVLIGLIVASAATHGLAVGIGASVGALVPSHYLQFAAATLFLGFAVAALGRETEDEESERLRFTLGPALTVAVTFFVSELGDKTQLATVALATKYAHSWLVWLGAVSGMILADTIALLLGSKLLKKLNKNILKLITATVFMLFAVATLISLLTGYSLPHWFNVIIYLVFLIGLVAFYLRARVLVRAIQQQHSLT